LIDSTFGAAIELGVPTHSSVSRNAEVVPKVFNDLKVGDFTLQSIAGYSMLFGPGEDGGARALEYGFVLGYSIPHRQLPLPGVLEVLPVMEMTGETGLNHDERTALLGVAREETHWGIVTSLVFQY
jgi:hypothetical protein